MFSRSKGSRKGSLSSRSQSPWPGMIVVSKQHEIERARRHKKLMEKMEADMNQPDTRTPQTRTPASTKRKSQGEASGSSASSSADATELCTICLSSAKTHAVVPCLHKCLCEKCAKRVAREGLTTCPICRGKVEKIGRVWE